MSLATMVITGPVNGFLSLIIPPFIAPGDLGRLFLSVSVVTSDVYVSPEPIVFSLDFQPNTFE